ncbi:MAG: queuine tRNA-ribosyltransferase family protein [Anaerolineae bacterium]|nr:queuine tRNA-ribosyltransferase family protein [Anaerolineae bacterium]
MSYSEKTTITLPHGNLPLPAFLPDATYGMVRAVDAADLEASQVPALVMNTFHLMQRPGSSTIQALGGLHRMSGWRRPIVTDSGGFQAYSLIHQNPKLGYINDNELVFKPEGKSRSVRLTPEKSVQLQMAYGTDVVICLDDCTHAEAPRAEQEASVRRTIAWAKRSRTEFDRLTAEKKLAPEQRPLLFAVIQGGGEFDLRRACAEALLSIGFDGYGYGGWPLDGAGKLLTDILTFTRALVPPQFPFHALGVGHPANVLACARLGYSLFDSAMPTRDARHGRVYAFTNAEGLDGKWFRYLYIEDERHKKANQPVSPGCDCVTCAHYSLGYLHHLFKMNDSLFPRLATLHNLRFMTQLTARIQRSGT